MTTGIVRSTGLNLREVPDGSLVDQLKAGDKLDILDRRPGRKIKEWLRVRDQKTGQLGWVASHSVNGDVLVEIEEEATPIPPPYLPHPRDILEPEHVFPWSKVAIGFAAAVILLLTAWLLTL